MGRFRNKRKIWFRGGINLLITIPIYLFILVGTLRLCYVRTLHETKLANIFIQETQGYYLVENLMALARDYAYQIVQNPREPHLFLSASAYRTKDKSSFNGNEGWVIDFNGSLIKQQIVPDDFSLKIADKGWDIKGGPIFWKDNKKKDKDERYLAEVFMLGSLKFVSTLIPNWTIRTVQTMEIERNPLCDFQLYAEGDITLNTNITDDTYPIEINGPIQINGNARFSTTNGEANNHIQFLNKFNTSGYALKLLGGENSLNNYVLPKKYHIVDNCWNNQTASGKGSDSYFFNQYAINYNDFNSNKISVAHNDFDPNKEYKSKLYDSYERYIFKTYRGNFNTCSRVYRPIGFDPSNYWGFWESSKSQPNVIDQNKHVLNFCFGFHNLAQSSSNSSHGLYSNTGENNYSPQYAIGKLRGLNSYQMTEKARLVEMQKVANFPGLIIDINTQKNNDISPYVPNNFIHSTYLSDAFPASKDNIYLNRYFNLAFQSNSMIQEPKLEERTTPTIAYYFGSDELPKDNDILKHNMYIDICNNNFVSYSTNDQVNTKNIENNSIAKLKSTFSPTSSEDDNCPPNKLVDAGSYWTLDNYVARITGEHYNFMYDRNRAKWIQMIDIDVGALTEFLNKDENASIPPVVVVNTHWKGECDRLPNKNYRIVNKKNLEDIRYNYSTNRTNFFSKHTDGSYLYPKHDEDNNYPPVIDIGVRLINAQALPDRGLTFCCPYPLYIKGDFNTKGIGTTYLPSVTTSGKIQKDNFGIKKFEISYLPSRRTPMLITKEGTVSGTIPVHVVAYDMLSRPAPGWGDIPVTGTVDSQGNLMVSGSGNVDITYYYIVSGKQQELPAGTISVTVSGTKIISNITKTRPPALIIADSITLLPDNWQDWRSQMDPINSHLWYDGTEYTANGPTIYADIITGRTHPHFWIQGPDEKDGTTPNPDLGIHDAFRTLCEFQTPIQLHGSLMLPYFCQEQWEPPINFCPTTPKNRKPSIYGYPPLTMHPREDAGIPMGMPFYYRINRGRKTHYLGNKAYDLLSGDELYGKDWSAGTNNTTFSIYHEALPNYLQYEVKPLTPQ